MLEDKVYRPGLRVPQTGLYRVFHYQHRLPHDVVMKQGEAFPACNKCAERVTFNVVATADSLTADQDFVMVEAA